MRDDRLLDLRGTYQVRARHVVHGPAEVFAGLPVLRGFGFDVVEAEPVSRRKIPGGTVKLVFALDGIFEGRAIEPGAFVIGMHDRGGMATHAGRMVSVQVQLDPLTARRLLGAPLDELRNGSADLSEFFGASARRLTVRLAETPGWAQRFALVAGYLRGRVADADEAGDPRDAAIAYAVRRLRHGDAALPELISESGWSQRHFRRLFLEQVGLPPKTYGSLMRFTAALHALARHGRAPDAVAQRDHAGAPRRARSSTAGQPDISRIASEAGYYDQAHLHRDFLRFAGMPPGRLLG